MAEECMVWSVLPRTGFFGTRLEVKTIQFIPFKIAMPWLHTPAICCALPLLITIITFCDTLKVVSKPVHVLEDFKVLWPMEWIMLKLFWHHEQEPLIYHWVMLMDNIWMQHLRWRKLFNMLSSDWAYHLQI